MSTNKTVAKSDPKFERLADAAQALLKAMPMSTPGLQGFASESVELYMALQEVRPNKKFRDNEADIQEGYRGNPT